MRIVIFLVTLAALILGGTEFYLDPVRGSDSAPGSRKAPWKTLQGKKLSPGDKVFFLPGVYGQIRFHFSGAPGKPITFSGIGRAILDGGGKRTPGHIKGAHLRFEKLTFRNAAHTCIMAARSKDLVFDRVLVRGGRMGFWLYLCEKTVIADSDVEKVSDGIYIDCCKGTTVRNNRIGKDFHGRRDGICVYAPGSVALAAEPVKVKLLASGKALLEIDGTVVRRKKFAGFHTLRRGSLRGSGDDSSSGLLLFRTFKKGSGREWDQGEDLIPGGRGYFYDERPWFKLVNNPAWNNKPYSPDGRKLLFDPLELTDAELSRAKFALVAFVHPVSKARTVDTLIENNVINGTGRQGIRTQRAFNTLIRNNTIINCGASGIQLESSSFNTLVTGNTVKDHNRFYRNETGIWIHENADAVVERNYISGCQKGMGLTQSYRCLVRFNRIENNRAQHIPAENRHLTIQNVNAIYVTGGNYRKVGLTPGCADNAVVCNNFSDNGLPESRYGVFGFPVPSSPPIGRNLFACNTISGKNGKVLISWFKDPGIVIFGNRWPQGEHVVNIENKKQIPFKEWITFEKKRPLALTASQGRGKVLAVDHPEVFYAGFSFSGGRKITPGDMISAGKAKARVVKVDIPGKKLHLDRSISWKKNVPVQYLFKK